MHDFKLSIKFMKIICKRQVIYLRTTVVRKKKMAPVQKKWTPVQKKRPLCKKNEPRNKKISVKIFIFFVDKLNMIDFDIFKMFKLIFTCESCAISITE